MMFMGLGAITDPRFGIGTRVFNVTQAPSPPLTSAPASDPVAPPVVIVDPITPNTVAVPPNACAYGSDPAGNCLPPPGMMPGVPVQAVADTVNWIWKPLALVTGVLALALGVTVYKNRKRIASAV